MATYSTVAPAESALPTKIARTLPVGTALGWVVLISFVMWMILMFVTNEHIETSVIGEFLFNPNILHGLQNTLLLAVFAQIIAWFLGVIVGFGRLSTNRPFNVAAWLFVWAFRSAPLVVQILLWGNLALFLPKLGFGSWSIETNTVMTPFVAGVIALALHETAYVAEVVRSGIMSVAPGQREASAALGLSWWQTQRRVILPQALRIMIPPLGSTFVLLLKSTSLVVVIAGGDLLTEAQNISSVNLRTIELLAVATIWFLVITSVANVGQWLLERRFDRQNRLDRDIADVTALRGGA